MNLLVFFEKKKKKYNMNELVPPDIINEDSSVDMAVQEGEDAALTCRASGNPVPRVTWKKEDGDFIYIRKQGNRDLMKGQRLNIYVI